MLQMERTLGFATRFLEEVRHDIGRAAPLGATTPPRIRSVHETPGHATPEFRTLNIPVPETLGGAGPEVLSGAIARYAAQKKPSRVLLAFEAEMDGGPVLVAEARDALGTRLFWMQPFRVEGRRVAWQEPLQGGWRDPGDEDMILDASFPRRAGVEEEEHPHARRRGGRAPAAAEAPLAYAATARDEERRQVPSEERRGDAFAEPGRGGEPNLRSSSE
jgi:hypothetical protein